MRTVYPIILLAAVGCVAGDPPLPPHEALEQAARSIDRILAENAVDSASTSIKQPAGTTRSDSTVSFWYYMHPLVAPAFAQTESGDFVAPGSSGIRVRAQYIGEWSQAVQKLTVSLAAGDVPDAAMVKRGWLALLAGSGRIRDLESVLPEAFLADLRPEIRRAYSVNGHLAALPADGFCSVLFYNRDLAGGAAPNTWEALREKAQQLQERSAAASPPFYPIGSMPYLEALWSADGDVTRDSRCDLGSSAARNALDFLVDLRRDGLAAPLADGDASTGLQMFLKQRVAFTVAPSSSLPVTAPAAFSVGLAPVPGETGAISRLSNDVVVFFAKKENARPEALTALAEYLTGPDVQGKQGVAKGSVPVRESVREMVEAPPDLDAAFRASRATPLIAPWNEIEFELERFLDRAYRWGASGKGPVPASR